MDVKTSPQMKDEIPLIYFFVVTHRATRQLNVVIKTVTPLQTQFQECAAQGHLHNRQVDYQPRQGIHRWTFGRAGAPTQ